MNDNSLSPCLLKRVEKLEKEAEVFGFYWDSFEQLIEQIQSECAEIVEARAKGDVAHLQEEIGDIIHATLSLAVFCNFDPRETLLKSIEKFQKRYDAVVQLAQADGLKTLHNQPLDVLMHYWNRAKLKS